MPKLATRHPHKRNYLKMSVLFDFLSHCSMESIDVHANNLDAIATEMWIAMDSRHMEQIKQLTIRYHKRLKRQQKTIDRMLK